MKTIDEDIRSGQFQNIYLLYGSEHYLRQQYKQKLKQALIPADDTINFSRFEGQHTDVSALIDLAEPLP